jgi:hypothetical protein
MGTCFASAFDTEIDREKRRASSQLKQTIGFADSTQTSRRCAARGDVNTS